MTVSGLAAVKITGIDAGIDQLDLNGQAGNDTIDASKLKANLVKLTINGGDGDDIITGSAGNDLVNGGRGNDTAFLGAGDDTFVWNPGDGSDIVEGQAGTDTMLFNGANVNENINISANGSRVRFTRDVANITMDLNGLGHQLPSPRRRTITVGNLAAPGDGVNIDLASPLVAHRRWSADTVIVALVGPTRRCVRHREGCTIDWAGARSTSPVPTSQRSATVNALARDDAPPRALVGPAFSSPVTVTAPDVLIGGSAAALLGGASGEFYRRSRGRHPRRGTGNNI